MCGGRSRSCRKAVTAGASPGRATDLRSAAAALSPLARRCGGDLAAFLAEIALGAQADALVISFGAGCDPCQRMAGRLTADLASIGIGLTVENRDDPWAAAGQLDPTSR